MQKTSKAKPRPPAMSKSLNAKSGPTAMQKMLKQNLYEAVIIENKVRLAARGRSQTIASEGCPTLVKHHYN